MSLGQFELGIKTRRLPVVLNLKLCVAEQHPASNLTQQKPFWFESTPEKVSKQHAIW